ncbi:MAG: M20 metallopeptidase family protein [Chitinophagales bacterium]
MPISSEKIKQLVCDIFPQVQSWRRHIHAHPELAFEEHETAAFVSKILSENNIEHQTGIAQTGVIALIKGKNPESKCIALRADMDALPIQEQNTHDFVSKNEGKMHACGHDFHTASLLGAGVLLQKMKEEFEGTVKLIFQPSEEKMPGGASVMIKEDVLENPKVDCIIGQHVTPEVDTGKIGFCAGEFMASADEIYLTVKGKGGHAAFPHQVTDPVIAAAQILVNLQQVVSRKRNPFIPAVLSFGKIEANGATNIIPNEVKIAGTLRAMDEKWRKEAQQWIKTIAENIAKSLGVECDVNIVVGYPCLKNDETLTPKMKEKAMQFLGEKQVFDIAKRMGAEDFAYYSQQIPACFYRIGTGSDENTRNGLHTPNFDIDEKALETSVGLFVALVCQ